MEGGTIIAGSLSMLGYISKITSLDEWKRILESEAEYLKATILDIGGRISSTPVQPSKKRKQDHVLCCWIAGGENLVEKTQCLLRDIGSWRSYILSPIMNWEAHKMFSALRGHGKEGDEILEQALSNAVGLCPACHIPVKQIVGRVASETLDKLKGLMDCDKVGKIAIYGIEGVGKTFLMKHLHNWALDKFDCVVWVTSPDVFTTKSLQDAIASVVNCDISSIIDLNVRSIKLSQKLSDHGRFALFLDGVPEVAFALDNIGLPIPAEGSGCKLILSTRANINLRSFVTVEVVPLLRKEAYQLFEQEAGIDQGVVSSLDKMPRLLVDTCSEVPRKIVDLGTRMFGRDDPHEWSYELFQSGYLGRKKNKLPMAAEIVRRSKRLKKDMVSNPITSGEGETSSSVHKSG